MKRNILVVLDDTQSGAVARQEALDYAKRTGGQLSLLSTVNVETLPEEPGLLVRSAAYTRADDGAVAAARAELNKIAEPYKQECSAAGQQLEIIEDQAIPYAAIGRHALMHDLVVIGKETNFSAAPHTETEETISVLLKHASRPLIVMPSKAPEKNGKVVLAFDGSIPAAHAMQLFCLIGLAEGMSVIVVNVDSDLERARATGERGASYLRAHGIDVTVQPVMKSGHPMESILSTVSHEKPEMLVMGAYGTSGWRETLLGSSTSGMLRDCPVPIFLYH